MKGLDHYWYSQNPVAWLLLPVSGLYCFLVIVRRWLYKKKFLKSTRLPVPVIVVGNIAVGGTGKTPFLIGLCELLQQHGFKPGVISRGYGGNLHGEKQITHTDTPVTVGDEPCLIAQRTACPVVVGRDRVAAAQLLLEHNACDIIVSDDGLQHYRMQRDMELAIVDVERLHGNGFCLPSGPLRETVVRLNDVDKVVYHGNTDNENHFVLEFSLAINIKTRETRPVSAFANETVHAVAGIGYPRRFFDQLKQSGLSIIEHAFPDHHPYTLGDLAFGDDKTILMTEKDAVKCRQFGSGSQFDSEIDNIWYIPVVAKLSDAMADQLVEHSRRLIRA